MENESVIDSTQWFDQLLKKVPQIYKPTDGTILDLYVDAFHGSFSYALNYKELRNIDQAKACVVTIE